MIGAILVCLANSLLFGYASQRISEYRGEPSGFWWGFWLGPLGILIVVFRKSSVVDLNTAPPGSSVRQSWLCGRCGARNPAGRENCQSCTAARDTAVPTRYCASCGAKNKASNQNCFACGKELKN